MHSVQSELNHWEPLKTPGEREVETDKQLIGKKRKDATQQEIRAYNKQLLEAKPLECKSWLENEMFDLVDIRKLRKKLGDRTRGPDHQKRRGRKLRTVRGFQDRQNNEQQAGSAAASKSGFRFAVQAAANNGWNIFYMHLKTAFLQVEGFMTLVK